MNNFVKDYCNERAVEMTDLTRSRYQHDLGFHPLIKDNSPLGKKLRNARRVKGAEDVRQSEVLGKVHVKQGKSPGEQQMEKFNFSAEDQKMVDEAQSILHA